MNRCSTCGGITVAVNWEGTCPSCAAPEATPGPDRSRGHATCAWCARSFSTIVDLLDHVDRGHLVEVAVPAQPVHGVVLQRRSARHLATLAASPSDGTKRRCR